MADLNCKACEDLKKEVPSLIVNGLSNTMCNSLQNDTGLKASSNNDDCEDLNDMNDCLIGNLDTEIDRYDTCDWKDFTKMFIDNLWTTLKAMICAICGIWTNIHDLWDYARSYRLKKNGNKIYLEASDGKHGEVIDDDTTYQISISGHTITLTGSDGSTDSVTVPDNDTKYDISINGHTIKLNGSDGTTDSVTVPDNDTTYTLSRTGHTVKLNGSDGTTDSVTLPDDDTKYHLEGSGTHTIHLKGTDNSDDTFTIPDNDTWQKNTSTQDGYVTAGGDDPLKVWCTNANGIPGWRNSPTLGGSLTLYNHDGPIGETKYWEASSARSLATDTELKIDTGIDLTAGTWICCATIGYDINENGNRALGVSFGSAAHRKGVYVRASDHYNGGSGYGSETILAKTYIHKVNSGDTERVYLNAYQNSGSSLNILSHPETYVYCIRIC